MSPKVSKINIENISNPNFSASESISASQQQVKIWDILVRFTHWAVATGVIANLAFTKEGSNIHMFVGFMVVALVVIRLLWGLVGSKYARFSDFFPTPTRLKNHLNELKAQNLNNQSVKTEHLGHNPLGALMMFALWGAIIGLGMTGYLMESQILGNKDLFEGIHGVLANSLYVLVPLHVISAIVMSRLQKQNLIKSMITGNKTVNKTE
ncbi:cytochrome b/b6 domain-containing protein [Psychrobacter phenylpyruvicus]|uniref:Cytochrome b n=1 Tax=Psychrobacter phenylpyruvicus TaxID=29432 RepID=A0A379LL99_9GAMM|nr:cytochrome b/b6 domain-containing protein [Psychrobacter phenylpyruvicus]SUD90552.1 Cytochrome b [Psychrobacter phenylpyruvicus]